MVVLEADRVSKSYPVPGRGVVWAVRGVSLVAERGRLTSLVGPSGSGKTTLLALLGGIERPTEGRVLLLGNDLAACSDAELARTRRTIGQIFQSFALIPQLSALENVTYPLIPRGVPRAERNRRAVDWLTRLGMGGQFDRPA